MIDFIKFVANDEGWRNLVLFVFVVAPVSYFSGGAFYRFVNPEEFQ